jgi:hypothetical protein
MSSINNMYRRRRSSSDYDSDRYCGLDSEIDWEDRFYETHGYYPNDHPEDEGDEPPEDHDESYYDYTDYLEARNRYDEYSYEYEQDNEYCNCDDCNKQHNKENIPKEKPITDSVNGSAKVVENITENGSAKVVENITENDMIPAEYMRKLSIANKRKKSVRMSQDQYKKYLARKENKKKNSRFGDVKNKILKEKKNKCSNKKIFNDF